MRTYGRLPDAEGNLHWVVVTTDAGGFDDAVWITTLAQALRLNLGESPFFADYGIPAHQSVVQQVWPDYYVALAQQRFAPHFASLTVARQTGTTPTYQINVITNQGAVVNFKLPAGFVFGGSSFGGAAF